MAKYEVGQEVRVFSHMGQRFNQPEGGWVGKVTKVGRKIVTVAFSNGEEQFRIEDGRRNHKDYPHWYSVKTLEEAEDDRRRSNAINTLDKYHVNIEWTWRVDWTVEELEALADFLDNLKGKKEQ
ncbi:hypothetical protein AB0K16_21995 [Nonomuraea jabiensis]|uniref:beta barrel domain-containing protein n=1 Tax=Nonomuraea jabiensis TaxID=882448 RepID=UPI00342F2A21